MVELTISGVQSISGDVMGHVEVFSSSLARGFGQIVLDGAPQTQQTIVSQKL